MNKAILLELKEKADAEDKEAEYQYGICLMNGVCVKQDLPLAFSYLLRSADHMGLKARRLLGNAFKTRSIYDWYQKLVEVEHRRAQYELGKYYDDILHNPNDAFSLYLSSANQNEADAIFAVAVAYRNGKGVAKNNLEANRYFEKYIKLDDVRVEELVKNTPEVIDWLKELETSGSVEAKYQLARIDYIINNTPVKDEPCWSRFCAAADAGHARAAFDVAYALYKARDYGGCYRYSKISADGGEPVGKAWYGYFLQNKQDRTEDEEKESFRYLKETADAGDCNSIMYVARAYAAGIGVKKDGIRAHEWLEEHILNKDGDGKFALFMGDIYLGGQLKWNGKSSVYDIKKAFDAYQLAAQKGEAEALYQLGLFYNGEYFNDFGTDYTKAHQYFIKAAKYIDAHISEIKDKEKEANMYGCIRDHFIYTPWGVIDVDLKEAYYWGQKQMAASRCEDFHYTESIEEWYESSVKRLKKEVEIREKAERDMIDKKEFAFNERPNLYSTGLFCTNEDGFFVDDPEIAHLHNKLMIACTALAYIAYEYFTTDIKSPYNYRRLRQAFQWIKDAERGRLGVDEEVIEKLGKVDQTEILIDWYKQLAESKNINGELAYADLLVEEGASFSEPPCRELYLNAATHGHPQGLYKAYQIYKDSDPEKSLNYLKSAVDVNHPEAQYDYGRILLTKENRTQEESLRAFQLFMSAATLGFEEALLPLVYCYECGIGTERNIVKAREKCQCYIEYQGVKSSYARLRMVDLMDKYDAVREYFRLARYEYRDAQYGLGLFYGGWKRDYSGKVIIENGELVFLYSLKLDQMEKVDLEKSFEWLVKSAKKGHTGAQIVLGNAFKTKNIRDWLEYYAEEGYPTFQFGLAELLFSEEKAESKEKAIQLYEAAFKQKHMGAAFRLACYYRKKADRKEKIYAESLKKAADEKSPWGMAKYAFFIFDNDPNKADNLLQEAADLDSSEAALWIGRHYFEENDSFNIDFRLVYRYLLNGAISAKAASDFPYEIDPLQNDYSKWMHELLVKGCKKVEEQYPRVVSIKKDEDMTLETVKKLLDRCLFLYNREGNTSIQNLCVLNNTAKLFLKLIKATFDFHCVFKYFQRYDDFWSSVNGKFERREGVLGLEKEFQQFYHSYLIMKLIKGYKKSENRYVEKKTGKTIYYVPDFSSEFHWHAQAWFFTENYFDDYIKLLARGGHRSNNFWYGLALAFDIQGMYEEAIFIYEYAALCGNKKAWYSLVNMGQEESLYFLEMINDYKTSQTTSRRDVLLETLNDIGIPLFFKEDDLTLKKLT